MYIAENDTFSSNKIIQKYNEESLKSGCIENHFKRPECKPHNFHITAVDPNINSAEMYIQTLRANTLSQNFFLAVLVHTASKHNVLGGAYLLIHN